MSTQCIKRTSPIVLGGVLGLTSLTLIGIGTLAWLKVPRGNLFWRYCTAPTIAKRVTWAMCFGGVGILAVVQGGVTLARRAKKNSSTDKDSTHYFTENMIVLVVTMCIFYGIPMVLLRMRLTSWSYAAIKGFSIVSGVMGLGIGVEGLWEHRLQLNPEFDTSV